MRWMNIVLAACSVSCLVDARAVPITISDSENGLQSLWSTSASTDRFSDFTLQSSLSSIFQLTKFDSSLGTLLSAELTLTSVTSHPTRSLFLPDVSGLPIDLPLGAIAQDTERDLHGTLNLWAYYDARVSYRADYRMTVNPLNTNLFAPIAAEAAFGSCARTEDLFLDIGNTNPYCIAGNNGSPLGDFNYSWGALTGADLAQFIGNDPLRFNARMTGEAFGHCDNDDVGDYCRVHLAMNWGWNLSVSYIYEPGMPDTGGGSGGGGSSGGNGGGNPLPVSEPSTDGLFSIALFALVAIRRRRVKLQNVFA